LISLLGACAFDDDTGEAASETRLVQDLREDREDVAPLKGRWTGSLSRGGRDVPVDLLVDERLVATGRDVNGQIIYRVSPVVTFRTTTEPMYPPQTFVGRYLKQTGEFIASADETPGSPANPDDLHFFSLVFNGRSLHGRLVAKGYVVGPLNFDRKTALGSDSAIDTEEEYNALLRSAYRRLVGDFHGRVDEKSSVTPNYAVCISIYLTEQPVAGASTRPSLRAFYRRFSTADPGLFDRTMNLSYNLKSPVPTVLLSSRDGTAMGSLNIGRYEVNLFIKPTDPFGFEPVKTFTGQHTNLLTGAMGAISLRRGRPCQ
jgi:hypothetical protein